MLYTDGVIYCDFCNKSQHELVSLIAGPSNLHICNECVAVCVSILPPEDLKPESTPPPH